MTIQRPIQHRGLLHLVRLCSLISLLSFTASLPSYGQGNDWVDRNRNYGDQRDVFHGAVAGNVVQASRIDILNKITDTDDVAAVLSVVSGQLVLDASYDIRFQPIVGSQIEMATEVEFDNYVGTKIKWYENSYRTDVEAFTLVQVSDRDFEWRSDTINDLMNLDEAGDLLTLRDITAGRDVVAGETFEHSSASVGDKYYLYSTTYKLSISPNDFDFTSDYYFKWHSDTNSDAMALNGDTGDLALEGGLTVGGNINTADQIIQDATEVQGTKFHFRQAWDEPSEAALKAKLNNGDFVIFMIDGGPISLGVKFGDVLRTQELVLYASRDPEKEYGAALKWDDEIYLAHTHYPT